VSELPLRVVHTEDLDVEPLRWLRERCEVVRAEWNDEPALRRALETADALVVRTYTRVDQRLLAMAPRLRVVGRAGVGLDNIDLAACEARGVRVVHTPDANSSAVAELVFALIFDALRPRAFLDRALGPAEWDQARRELVAPRQLEDLTLGVLGLGRVGRRVAAAGRGFGMRVLANDIRDVPEAEGGGAELVSRDRLLREADVLSIHVDGRAENRDLIGAGVLALAKDDVVLLNTSRGFVVNVAALAEFLREHPAACAMLDVHEPEPIPADHPLLGVANAHLLPHIGAKTARAQRAMSWVVRDVWRELAGDTPR
jgi:phosphoglycerate dehydrogenase-like enzyme